VCDTRPVDESQIIQGRQVGPSELAQVRQLLAGHPEWSRWRLSRELAALWHWRNGVGQLKDMAARTLLLKLEQRGWITLPARKRAAFNRMRQKPMLGLAPPVSGAPLNQSLETLLPLVITEVSGLAGSQPRALFEALLHQHHYLSYRSSVGENLQYLVCDGEARPLACVLFGAAAWQCADRDRYIGWSSPRRAQHLHLLTNNTRFLIPTWVRVPLLASHVLSRVLRRLSRDWQRKYGHPIYLLETFVEVPRFAGTSYQAANWVRVGQTKGRSRQDRPDGTWQQVPIKDVYVYPLHPRFRERLQGLSDPPHPGANLTSCPHDPH
jgi:hypothetical protein